MRFIVALVNLSRHPTWLLNTLVCSKIGLAWRSSPLRTQSGRVMWDFITGATATVIAVFCSFEANGRLSRAEEKRTAETVWDDLGAGPRGEPPRILLR